MESKKRIIHKTRYLLLAIFLCISSIVSAQVQHQQRVITDFSGIDIEGGFNVHLIQGDEEKVILESTSQDIFNSIDITNNSGTLTVRSRGLDTGGIYKVGLFIYFKNIDQITAHLLSGTFDAYTQLILDRLDLTINGAMTIKLQLTCSDLKVTMSNVFTCIMQGIVTGNGDLTLNNIKTFYAANLQVSTLTVTCSDVKKGNVWADREINVDAHGYGSLNYKGSPVEGSMVVKAPFTVGKG